MISLIMPGSVINYLTRSTLAVAAPTVLQELHIGTRFCRRLLPGRGRHSPPGGFRLFCVPRTKLSVDPFTEEPSV